MEATKISNELPLFNYFEVDSMGKVHYLCPDLCKDFGLKRSEIIGTPVDTFFTAQSNRKQWKDIGNNKKVVFGMIGGEPCLVHISPCVNEGWKGYICRVIIQKQDVEARDILSFWKSIHPENKFQNSKITTNSYSHRYSFEQIVGSSPAMEEVIELASRVAKSRSTVLITGESGTGKELFAQAIHDLSPRREGPFVAVNCSAIPEQLFESELFGYEGGAFSGAKKEGKPGKIELAQDGTLFLDEISELPLLLQGKLLRVLQEREIERIGSTGRKIIDIRIIAATNKNLKTLVDQGKFRQDLYYRLKVFELRIPSLKERHEDILDLTWSFIKKFNKQLGLNVQYIDLSLQHWLLNYQWPGNVRELQAAIERGMNIVDGDTLHLDDIGLHSELFHEETNLDKNPHHEEYLPLEEVVAMAEISAIRRALKKAKGDRMIAAQILKIHVASLYRKLSKYNIHDI
jgi:transcriptional regulator with PAS, ATPase and Fis domain